MVDLVAYGLTDPVGQFSPVAVTDELGGASGSDLSLRAATLVRANSGAASLFEDANTTTITVGGGAANTETLLNSPLITVSGAIVPDVTDTLDLGITGTRFRNIFITGSITAGGSAAFDFLNVGSTTVTAVANGDLAAGDGTRKLFWDASTGILNQTGITAAAEVVNIEGDANGIISTNVRNTNSGTTAEARLACNSDAAGIGLIATSSGFTPLQARTPATGLLQTGNGMTGGININTGASGTFQIGFWQNGSESWSINTSRHLVTGQAGIDIGSTTDAEQPRDLHLNRALNVGDITASASEGDITAGIGSAHRLFYDASENNLSMKTTITPGVESSQWEYFGVSTGTAFVRQTDTTAETNTIANMHRLRRDRTTSTVLPGFGISTDTRMMIQGGGIAQPTRTSHVWTNATDSTALASHYKIELQVTGVAAGTLTEIFRLEGDGLITQLAGGIEIGAAVTTTAEVGDIVAGDGTREFFWDASAGTTTITPKTYVGSAPVFSGELNALTAVGSSAFFIKAAANTFLAFRHSIAGGDATDFHLVELS